MKQPRSTDSEVVDTVLRALGSAEPPTNLEQRMQKLIQETLHEQAASPPSLRAPSLAWMPPHVLGLGVMATLILITGAILYQAEHRNSVKDLRSSTNFPAKQPTSPVVAVPENSTPSVAQSYAPAGKRPHAAKFANIDRTVSPVRHLVSYPAPPAPLTAEEKLLLRIAQSPNQQQLAMLDPVQRARDNARSDEEFEKFIHQNEMRKTP